MANNEGAEFTLPSIPYFYHDIVARIIPGAIQLGLIAALATHHLHQTEWVENKLHLKALFDASQVAAGLMLLAAAYFVGVFFEGLSWLVRMFGFYRCGFSRALPIEARNRLGDKVSELADDASSILESYEPLAPHFFARATRFLAEAKMMFHCALAMPIAVLVVWFSTREWPLTWPVFISGVVMFALFIVVAFGRQKRRAVEILRCVKYLAGCADLPEAHNRAKEAWQKVAPVAPEPDANSNTVG